MKIETLKKNNKKKWLIGSIVVIALIITITFIGSRAKFKSTAHASIAKGIINYNYDLDIVAVNIQNDDGKYVSSQEVPSSGYTLNKEKSFCKVNGEKVNVSMEHKGKVYISTNKKGTKCELYFDKGTFKTKDLILSHNSIDTTRISGHFSSPFTENTAGRIFNALDADGETFFFAGTNPNNWVKFGTNKEGQDLYWRIIRINGDESIRIIYNGPTMEEEADTTSIGTSQFNPNGDNAYIGYMYGTPGSNTYEETHANTNDSLVKAFADNWYETNLKNNYEQYIDLNAGFCGNRRTAGPLEEWYKYDTKKGYGTNETAYFNWPKWDIYDAGGVNKDIFSPSYFCSQEHDLYTHESSTKGNKALRNPIGLITNDEALYAGGKFSITYKIWLQSGINYWTISPHAYSGNGWVIGIHSNNSGNNNISSYNNVRPVINLKADTLKIGSGTTTDPYRIN